MCNVKKIGEVFQIIIQETIANGLKVRELKLLYCLHSSVHLLQNRKTDTNSVI